ncbi:MAG: NAD(P)(+) transhydrogenase (Re/Si-specific) subunit beta [Actinobacteria bacterium]|uniref:NAD(P) transhydrogenase subunit beta n=1 Tax=freshwater metagenome TaxID=449393 RepID=A0A6J6X496_9ZZZZ|nr:NAD(P)(+) transhydrogenase (Re/Si-specific) subunit beta [Actinomycetota bacterium]
MSRTTLIDLLYLVAATTFLIALKGLGSPKRARVGNIVAAIGMAIAIGATFFYQDAEGKSLEHINLMILGMVIGTIVAVPAARFVQMTAMPQLVAIFNGVGGGAAALVAITEFMHIKNEQPPTYVVLEVLLGVLIGTVSFSGSAIAYAKLQELMTGRPITYPGQQLINAIFGVTSLAIIVALLVSPSMTFLWVLLVLSFILGIAFVLPIGGADVPVLISLLNSFTGLAVAASGFTIGSNVLIVAGTLVGASGILLTRMMSKAMGRSLANVLFSAFGANVTASGDGAREDGRTVRSGTPEDIGVLLAYASKVIIIPGYGLAVAQAQHVVRELVDELEKKGVEVFYAIHPVAGRMPGHMNVLLAEANVPYEQLREMDEANSEMSTADVALVVGANDTVNPAAKADPSSPIYGMPIINADQAESVVFLKRSMRPGFAGIENELLFDPKTVLLFGDAKDTLTKLVSAVTNS